MPMSPARTLVPLLVSCVAVAIAGCAMHVPHLSDLRRRAAFDLQCPEAQLSHVDLGGEIHGVTGCGRRATYIRFCRAWAYGRCMNGDWVLNAPGSAMPQDEPDTRAPATPPTWGSPGSAH